MLLKCGIVTHQSTRAAVLSMASSPASSRVVASSASQPPLPAVPVLNLWRWFWPTLWVLLLVGAGSFSGWALIWLTRIPPTPDCDRITPFHSARDMLYCAAAQARAGEANTLQQAVTLTVNWPRTDANYEAAQEVLKDASEQILVLANRWAQAGRLEDAVNLAGQIPSQTPLRRSAQALIYNWQSEWSQGRAIEADLKAALVKQDWARARLHWQSFKTLKTDYWLSTRSAFWQRQIQIEQQGWEQLSTARQLAASSDLAKLQQAVNLARQINLGSQVWQQAEAEVDGWSQTLLKAGLDRWQAGDRQAALALVRGVPPSPHLYPEAADLLRLSHAQQLASTVSLDGPALKPRYGTMLNLMAAIAATQQISDGSLFAEEGQRFLPDWQAQLEDLRCLKFADLLASLGRRPTYELAIEQAQQVELGRPRRLQGQTLIADWRLSLERLEDRPLLLGAKALARPGTIPALQAAIDQAAQVQMGRPLRVEAQTLIADWRQEIQVIQDRPRLEAAVALAKQGKLTEAITAAQQIGPDRALHRRAQSLIQDWTATLQIAEDRPILDKAKDLAYGGKLTAAINLASQIGAGRALSGEAKAAIALWKSERDYIWSIWEAEGRPSPANPAPAPSSSPSE